MSVELRVEQERILATVNGQLRDVKRVVGGMKFNPPYILPSIKTLVEGNDND